MTKVQQMRLQKQQLKQQQEEERKKKGWARLTSREREGNLLSSQFDWTEVRRRFGQTFDVHDFVSYIAWNVGSDLRDVLKVPTFANTVWYLSGDVRTKKKKAAKILQDSTDSTPPIVNFDTKNSRVLNLANLLYAYMNGGLSLAHARRVHQRLVFSIFWSCALGVVLATILTAFIQ